MLTSFAYVVTLMRKDFVEYCNEKLSKIGLSQGLLFFILYIGKHPACSPKELSEALHMDIGHTARSLNKLIQTGFIIQATNPKDRRAHILNLTEHGQDSFRISHELFFSWDDEVLCMLNEDERTQLFMLLTKLVHKDNCCLVNNQNMEKEV